MPKPNRFEKATALGFEALHGKGVSATAVSLTGATAINIFGTINNFNGVITGLLLNTLGGTAATITIAGTAGTVATITSGNTAGSVAGNVAVLANATFTKTGTLIASSGNAADTSKLIVFYKLT
jgi:hypothetical protein